MDSVTIIRAVARRSLCHRAGYFDPAPQNSRSVTIARFVWCTEPCRKSEGENGSKQHEWWK